MKRDRYGYIYYPRFMRGKITKKKRILRSKYLSLPPRNNTFKLQFLELKIITI